MKKLKGGLDIYMDDYIDINIRHSYQRCDYRRLWFWMVKTAKIIVGKERM